MAVEVFGNLPATTVSSGGTTAPAGGTQETWTVASSALFPAVSSSAAPPTQLHIADIALNSEIISVINISGATWTVVRGAEGSTPVAHATGFTVYQVVSAGAYAQLRSVDWLNVVTMFGADPTGAADSTAAIQNAINAQAGPVYLPHGEYLVCTGGTSITLQEGTILQGSSSGTYLHGSAADAIPGASCLIRAASANCDVLVAPIGADYGRIRDLAIDGNESSNTSGFGMNIEDNSSGEETQWIIERCYFHDNPDSNLYIGHGRRGVRVLYSVFNYSANGDGITDCGSDALIMGNICGQNTSRAGINLGSSVTQNWSAFGSDSVSTVSQVIGNDTYQNLVGIAVPGGVVRTVITGNGIDRNQRQGVTVYDGDCNAITGNMFHSNGQAADNTYAHIDLGTGVQGAVIGGNVFGPVDSGITNLCTTCVNLQSWAYAGNITGDIGQADTTGSPDTHSGLINSSAGAAPATRLSDAGATIQGSGNNVVNVYSAGGGLLTTITDGGTFTHQGGAAHFTHTANIMGNTSGPGSTVLALVGNGTGNAQLKTQLASGQTADIWDMYASNGSTLLAKVDNTGAVTTPLVAASGLTGATAASRYAGATASGAPASGTFAAGDYVVDQTGVIWICTSAGTPGTWTSAAALALPLTGGTMSGAIAMGSHKITGLTNGSAAADAVAFGQVLTLQATTGTTSYTLVNGTGTIITWTTPNDGALHRVMFFGGMHVTSTETGGQITVNYTLPDGTTAAHSFFSAALAAGDQFPAGAFAVTVEANTAVSVKQNSALTGGAAVLWAEIWGS